MEVRPRSSAGDGPRAMPSPKPKGRENSKETLCRNLTIYGHCRYEDKGCAFNHDPSKAQQPPQTQADSLKKRLNVDSPTFTPSALSGNGRALTPKSTTISPRAANAAPFTPKGSASPAAHHVAETLDWTGPEIPEFIPQNFENLNLADSENIPPSYNSYTPYGTMSGSMSGIGTSLNPQQPQLNPYAQETNPLAAIGGSYFQGQGAYAQPPQYHLYAPIGPHKENLLPYQRTVHDFFIPDALREELQRKSEASLQVLPNSTLPAQVDHFHTLVPLDTSNQRNATTFGYPSWIYKAVSLKDGKFYALRRLEGYRLTNEKSIRSVQSWKRIDNGSLVTIHDAFTTGAFGDRSLIFVTDYHPLSKTLSDHHFGPGVRFTGRSAGAHIPEQTLWGYMVQIASALKTISGAGLAARLIDASKILLTSKNRIRLNACAIMDVVQFETQLTAAELQQDDLIQFGRLILSLASNNPAAVQNMPKAMEFIARSYSTEFKDCVLWLLTPSQSTSAKSIDQFLQGISGQMAASYNGSLHLDDQLNSELSRELENARLVRLLAKLNFINERPEFQHDPQWSETGERYFLKLFRDYVFHQVDVQGQPVISLAHILTCLNKLDAGIDEKITLVSRDEQNIFVITYREIKRGVESAFQDLVRASSTGQ